MGHGQALAPCAQRQFSVEARDPGAGESDPDEIKQLCASLPVELQGFGSTSNIKCAYFFHAQGIRGMECE
jgi:hypothetical protein